MTFFDAYYQNKVRFELFVRLIYTFGLDADVRGNFAKLIDVK